MNKLLEAVIGLGVLAVLGVFFPQILLGIVVGLIAMYFLKPMLDNLFEVAETVVKPKKKVKKNARRH